MQMCSNKRNKQEKDACEDGVVENRETDESNAGWHIEENRQVIYGMNYGDGS